MNQIQNIFFDLDGTLIDPQKGITGCIQYALLQMGYSCPNKNELAAFIGPPLRDTFKKLLNTNNKSLIEKAVYLYREQYLARGIYENIVYPGIIELLTELHNDSFKLFVVTTKPKKMADIIIRHFSLNFFDEVFGSELDGNFDDKTKLVNYILRTFALLSEETVMIGDRKLDIAAGKVNGTKTIGLTYGYGSQIEIFESAPDCICNSVQEIGNAITNRLMNSWQ